MDDVDIVCSDDAVAVAAVVVLIVLVVVGCTTVDSPVWYNMI